jgi:molecular chaperone DnaK
MYQQAAAGAEGGPGAAGGAGAGQAGSAGTSARPDEDVVDADFEEVKEEGKK